VGRGGAQSRRGNREIPGIMGRGRRDWGGGGSEAEREGAGQGALWCGAARWLAGKRRGGAGGVPRRRRF
jgi:hypothetical protein